MTPSRTRAAKGQGERLRDELLEATERLLLETGDESRVSIRAIASAVGVTPPAVYLHFEDKDDLILAVCARHFEQLDAAVLAADEGARSAVDAFGRRARAYVRYAVAHPEPYRILFMTRRGVTAEQLALAGHPGNVAFVHLVDIVRRCIDEGSIAAGDPVAIATGSWTVVHGLASLAISLPDFPLLGTDALVDQVVDAYIRGLS